MSRVTLFPLHCIVISLYYVYHLVILAAFPDPPVPRVTGRNGSIFSQRTGDRVPSGPAVLRTYFTLDRTGLSPWSGVRTTRTSGSGWQLYPLLTDLGRILARDIMRSVVDAGGASRLPPSPSTTFPKGRQPYRCKVG